MRLTFSLVWKSWVSNRLRTALSVLGVALGIAIVIAVHVLDHNTIQSRLRLLRPDFGRVDLELAPFDATRPPEEVRQALTSRPDIAAVGVLQQATVDLLVAGRPGVTLPMYGLSPLPSTDFAHYLVAEGADLSDLDGDRGILVGAALAQLAGLEPGSKLALARPAVPARVRCLGGVPTPEPAAEEVAAPATPVVVRGILAPHRLGARDQGLLVIASFSLARRFAPGRAVLYQVNRQPGVDVDRLRQQLASDFDVLDERSALLGEASDERAFRNGVKVIGCLALVLGMFVIFQTLSQSLVERLRQIGLLRCLGTSRRVIAGVFFVDAAATAMLGALLGLGLGIALAFVLQQLGISTLGRAKQIVTFELPWPPILGTAALGLVFTLAGALFPLVKARNLPPLEALGARGLGRDDLLRGVNLFLFAMLVLVLPSAYLAMTPILAEEGHEARIVLLQLGAMVLLFGGILLVAPSVVRGLGNLFLAPLRTWLHLPAFLVQKSLQRSPSRFAAAVCGLAVVLMALVALKSVTAALRADALQFGANSLDCRMFVKCNPVPRERAERLAAIPGVRRVDAFEGAVDTRFSLRGLPAAAVFAQGSLPSTPELLSAYVERRGLVISARLAHLRGKRAGDVLTLVTDEGTVAYTVVAVTDEVGFFPEERAWAVADPAWLRLDFCAGLNGVEQISLQVEPDADRHAVLAAARAQLDGVPWAKVGEDITAYSLRDVAGDFFLFDLLLGLILVLAGLGLVNTMTIAAMARRRELGVLRALGVDRTQLRTTFLVEGGLVAVIAALLAVGLAVPLGSVVVAGLNRVSGLNAPFVVPWPYLALVPILALLTGILAAILPGLRAVRESPAEAVRYE